MKPFLLALIPGILAAQAPVTLSVFSDKPTYPVGATINATVTLSGASQGLGSPTNVQFEITIPAGASIDPSAVTSADPAKMAISKMRDSSTLFVSVMGIQNSQVNVLPIPNGALVTIPIKTTSSVALGPFAISLSQTDGTAPDQLDDADVDSPVAGASLSVTMTSSLCDVNGDGKVDAKDVIAAATALVSNSPGSIVWPLTLLNVAEVTRVARTGSACTL